MSIDKINLSLWMRRVCIVFFRMVIAGGRGVGKSALAVRFLTRRFNLKSFEICSLRVLSSLDHIPMLKVHR